MSKCALALGAAAILVACNRPAAELPPDIGSVAATQSVSVSDFAEADRRLSCPEIDLQRSALQESADRLTEDIGGSRVNNQTVGYIGAALFPPALLLLDLDAAEKEQLVSLQTRDDTLIRLKFVKKCGRADG